MERTTIIFIITILLNLAMLIYSIIAFFFKFENKITKTVFITLNALLLLYLFMASLKFEFEISEQQIFDLGVKIFMTIIVFLTIKLLPLLKKNRWILLIVLLLEMLFFVVYVLIPKIHYFSFLDFSIIILTLYSGGMFFRQFLEPLCLPEKLRDFKKNAIGNLNDFIYKNSVLNKLMFIRNAFIMAICNLNCNNPIGYILYSIIGIFLIPYKVWHADYAACFYIAIFFSVLMFVNETLMFKYKNEKKFRSNFNRNMIDMSKIFYMVTRQTTPIQIKVIKRSMVRVIIDGYGSVEAGPIPHKTIKLLAVTALTGAFIAGGAYVVDSNNKAAVQIEEIRSRTEVEVAKAKEVAKAEIAKEVAKAEIAKAEAVKAKAEAVKAKAEAEAARLRFESSKGVFNKISSIFKK